MPQRSKSDRREMTVSSDDSTSGSLTSKCKYSHSSTRTHKSNEKYRQSKKSRNHRSESSSESDGAYDSKKENKVNKKHRKTLKEIHKSKKSSKSFEKLDRDNRFKDESPEYRNHRLDKEYRQDVSSDRRSRNSKQSRKRSGSQERQRYGKWAEDSDKIKDTHSNLGHGSSKNETDNYNNERYKHPRRENYDRYEKSSSRHSGNLSDNDERLPRTGKANKDNLHKKSNKEIERDKSPKRYDKRSTFDDEEKINDKKNYQKSNTSNQRDYSTGKRSRDYIDLDKPRREDQFVDEEIDAPKSSDTKKENSKKMEEVEPLSKRAKIGNINMRTGGAYIPPARLRMMQEKIKDKSSEEYQRIAWEALKKSIIGMTNKINSSNISNIVPELIKENIIRGRGILSRAIMQAQAASPTFTRVYAALVAIINSKYPEIGELILKRLIIQYKRSFRRNDKAICMTAARFLAHLLNQEVAHEVLILEIVTHLLEKPTEDSIEVAIAVLKECGKKLTQLTPRGMIAITQRVRDVLHEGNAERRVAYMIEVFFAVQKDGFKDFEVIPEELDLVQEDDKYTHLLNLDDAVDSQDMLNVFKFDPEYLENEEKYKSVVKEILGDSEDDESGDETGSEEEENEEEEKSEENQQIIDMTETNIVCLRRKIYLTIQSSLDFEECAHKLLKLELKPGQILEMCYMILDCCAQQRTYEKFFGLLAQRFCQMNKIYVEPFTEIFSNSYKTIHRLETNKLRNVAKFFAHLLYTDAISWTVLSIIKLNEEDTTSSSRIFIKILFQELCEYMGLPKLNERVKDITLQEAFDGLFPRDHPHNTRFAINFFTSIGLGGLTDELREHLKNMPKNSVIPVVAQNQVSTSSSSTSSSSTSSSSSSSSSSSDSD